MNAFELLPFLGHSSIHPQFDEFLTKHNISKRPSMKRNVEKTVFVPGTGLSLSFAFEVVAEKEGFVVKSPGTFIFRQLSIMIIASDKNDGQYSGMLSHGLTVSDTRSQIEKKMGSPKRRNEESDNYYLDGFVWTIAFDRDKFQFIQIDLPDNDWREFGICP